LKVISIHCSPFIFILNMPNFNRDNRDRGGRGGDRKFGGGGFKKSFGGGFGGRDGGRPEMHHATCSDCGKSCEVPFKPNGKKPVFCNDCFKNNGGGFEKSSEKNYDNNDYGNSYEKRGRNDRNDRNDRFGEKQMFQAVCDECGKPCEVPFRPSGDKPVYCNQCFGKDSFKDSFKGNKAAPAQSASMSVEQKEQLNVINVKLDRIMKALEMLTGEKMQLPVIKEGAPKATEKSSKKDKKQEELNEVFAEEAPMEKSEETPKPKKKKAAKKDSK